MVISFIMPKNSTLKTTRNDRNPENTIKLLHYIIPVKWQKRKVMEKVYACISVLAVDVARVTMCCLPGNVCITERH